MISGLSVQVTLPDVVAFGMAVAALLLQIATYQNEPEVKWTSGRRGQIVRPESGARREQSLYVMSKEWVLQLRWAAEILTRRIELFRARDEGELLSTLRWMAASGEHRDLELIEIARQSERFDSREVAILMDKAMSKIRTRMATRVTPGECLMVGGTDPFAFVDRQTVILLSRADKVSAGSDQWVRTLAATAEAIGRRTDLVRPPTKDAFRQAVSWVAACGEEVDLDLLKAVETRLPFRDTKVSGLIELAKIKVNARLYAHVRLGELLGADGQEAVSVARGVFRSGIVLRGTSAPRGNVIRSSDGKRLLDESTQPAVVNLLRSPELELRKQVALVLGEWGGAAEAAALAEAMQREGWQTEEGEQFALYCIAGLKNIGGHVAVRALCDALTNGTIVIQLAALNAIEDLATGGSEVFGQGVPHFNPPRGRYSRQAPPAPGTEEVTATLEKAMNEAESPAVRERSKELLEHVLI